MSPMKTSAPLLKGHRPGRVPRAVRSEQLLELADQLFAERGFHGASMDELASRAEVSKPVIYDHFGSKEQLFAACVRRTGEALAEQVDAEARKESEPRARLWAGSVAYFRFLQGQLQAWATLFAEEEVRDARFAAEASRIRHRQSDLMLNLMAETTGTTPTHEGRVRLEAMTLALAGAYESLSLWWREHPEVPPEQLADWLLDLLWPGLERLMTRLASANPDQAESSAAAGGSAGAVAPEAPG
jgi:AcrR family transcriptional regulator